MPWYLVEKLKLHGLARIVPDICDSLGLRSLGLCRQRIVTLGARGIASSGLVSPYKYTKIGSSEVRCISLVPGEEHVGHLSVCSKKEGKYCALSYEWGDLDSGNGHDITIMQDGSVIGRKYLTENLSNALSDLKRLAIEPKAFFIDQICINQDDTQEKSIQVAGMGDVYKHAEQVLTYLGPEEDDDICAIDLLHRVTSCFGEHYDEWDKTSGSKPDEFDPNHQGFPIDDVDAKALRHLQKILYSRGWTQRTWMTQEVMLNEQLRFFKGPRFLPSRSVFLFRLFCRFLTDKGEPPEPGHTNAFVLSLLRRDNRLKDSSFSYPLLMNLCGSRFDCKDPRDNIYALLGLARDNFGVQPDYSKSVTDVYTDFARKAIERTRSLDIFKYVYQTSTPLQMPKKAKPGTIWPSWVPAFEGLMLQGPKTTANACGFTTPEVYYESDVHHDKRMAIRGHHIGTIEKVLSRFDPGPLSTLSSFDDWEVIDRFIQGINEIEQGCLGMDSDNLDRILCHTMLGKSTAPSKDFTDSGWGECAGNVWRITVESLREARRVPFENSEDFIGYLIDYDAGTPEHAWLMKLMLSNIDVDKSSVCLTDKGEIVKALGAVEVGDAIVGLSGGSELYALRPNTEGTFQLLGPSYSSNYMDGQIFSNDEWDESLRLVILKAFDQDCRTINVKDTSVRTLAEQRFWCLTQAAFLGLVGGLFVSGDEYRAAFADKGAERKVARAARCFCDIPEDQQRQVVRGMIRSPPFAQGADNDWRHIFSLTIKRLIAEGVIRSPKWMCNAQTFLLV